MFDISHSFCAPVRAAMAHANSIIDRHLAILSTSRRTDTETVFISSDNDSSHIQIASVCLSRVLITLIDTGQFLSVCCLFPIPEHTIDPFFVCAIWQLESKTWRLIRCDF